MTTTSQGKSELRENLYTLFVHYPLNNNIYSSSTSLPSLTLLDDSAGAADDAAFFAALRW